MKSIYRHGMEGWYDTDSGVDIGNTGHPKRDPVTWGYEIEDAENRLRDKLNKEGYVLE